jgi:agmatinase
LNFLGLNEKSADYRNARVAVLQAPYEKTCTWGLGAAKGPEAIIRASEAAESYDEALGLDLEQVGIVTLPPPSIENLEPAEMVEAVFRMTLPVVRDGKIPAGLGGEHTVTLGFLKAVLQEKPSLSVLQIDAHPDLRDSYEGRRVCHATVGRRILELCPLVQAGVRAWSVEEKRFMEEQLALESRRLHLFSASTIHRTTGWIPKILDVLGPEVYLSLDLDALDPSIAPHTGTPEPGGLTWQEVCDLLGAVGSEKTVVGFDVVELAPDEGSRVSEFTAARLAMRLIGHAVSPGADAAGPPF